MGMSRQGSTSLPKSLLQVSEKNVLACEVLGAVRKKNVVKNKKKTNSTTEL